MSDEFNDKHLLWWVLQEIERVGEYGVTPHGLLYEDTWADAPAWVLPALQKKFAAIRTRT